MEKNMENIKENRDIILTKIKDIHKKSFFKNSVPPKLIAVSKKQEEYKIDDAIKIGQRFFGENRVQEAIQRWENRIKDYNDIELIKINRVAPIMIASFDIECSSSHGDFPQAKKTYKKPKYKNTVTI